MSSKQDPPEAFAQSLARGLAVIEAFGRGRQGLTLTEGARRASVSRGAAPAAYAGRGGLCRVRRQALRTAPARTRARLRLPVLDGSDIVHVIRLPAHASAMGRVMLAALPPKELDAYFATARISAITDRTVTDPRKLLAPLQACVRNIHRAIERLPVLAGCA